MKSNENVSITSLLFMNIDKLAVFFFFWQVACLTQVAANYLIGQKEAQRWGTAHGSIVPYQVREQQCKTGLSESAVLYDMSLRNDFFFFFKLSACPVIDLCLIITRFFCCSL